MFLLSIKTVGKVGGTVSYIKLAELGFLLPEKIAYYNLLQIISQNKKSFPNSSAYVVMT